MSMDTIVAEAREAREALAKQYNYDLRAMIEAARERQKASGRKVVSFPPKRPQSAKDQPKTVAVHDEMP